MATVERHFAASPDQIFDVLSDGWLYAIWVVGASQIRNVDRGWPTPGTKIHHSIGAWPLLLSDETEVVTAERPRKLVLRTKARPLGIAVVTLTIEPQGAGALVTMTEAPTNGPGRWVHNPFNDAVLKVRNVEALKRLASIAENRLPPAVTQGLA